MDSSGPNDAQSALYPPHFRKGAKIELGNGELKMVEDLTLEDFQRSTTLSPDLKLDISVLLSIEVDENDCKAFLSYSVGLERLRITIEAPLEHPFFVYGKGWCSVDPRLSKDRYQLNCKKLMAGDHCASLTLKEN